jgi:hypothetical protein
MLAPAACPHTSACVSMRQHTSAYVSIRQRNRYVRTCCLSASLPSCCGCVGSGQRRASAAAAAASTCQHTSAYVSAYVSIRQHTSEYVSIRQHTAAYVSIRHDTAAHVSIRQHTSAHVSTRQHASAYVSIRQHTSAYVSIRACAYDRDAIFSHNPQQPREHLFACAYCCKPPERLRRIRQHTSAYVSTRQHTSAHVSIRQHTSAYVSIRQHTSEKKKIRTSAAATRSCQVLPPPRIAGIIGIAAPPASSRGASAASGETAAGWESEERERGARVVCRCACGSGEISRRASSAATCSADLRVSALRVVRTSESAATCSADLRLSALKSQRLKESAP